MRALRSIGICILCALLMAGAFLSLASAFLSILPYSSFLLKKNVPSPAYCNEIRGFITEDLDYISILYGIDTDNLAGLISDQDISNYYNYSIDSIFSDNSGSAPVPVYPSEHFRAYLADHTTLGSQALTDLAEDCSASITADLSALHNSLLISAVQELKGSRLIKLSPVLCLTATILMIVLIAMIRTLCEDRRAVGKVAIFGGSFIGFSAVFVPLIVFWLFDYVGRLNLPISAFRSALTATVNMLLYGSLAVSGILVLLNFFLLVIASIQAAHLSPHSLRIHERSN